MSNFEIRQTTEKGRAMFATKTFQPGETILEEKPFVSSQFAWNCAYKYLACENCLKPLETAETNVGRLAGDKDIKLPFPDSCPTLKSVPNHTVCPHCGVEYCSEDCRIEAAQKYHFTLCLGNKRNDFDHPINQLLEAWKKIHYPPETTSINLIVKLLAMYKQCTDKPAFMGLLKDFQDKVVNENAMISHKMLGPNFDTQLQELYPLYCKAFSTDDLSLFLTPEAFKTFFAIIGTNGQGLGTSPFATWVKNVSELNISEDERSAVDVLIDDLYERLDEVTGLQFLNNEGSALYSTQSKINHSCVPNATPTFPYSNHTLVITALVTIEAGEEICISYLDECSLERSRHSRQKELKDNYLFICRCVKCNSQINDPDVTSDEEEDSDEEMED